jgi:tRNA nucleotidyltransferase (CCA-adding enzyme)
MTQLSEWFPELKATINVMQNEDYHKEGDVWTHTMMALDEAAKLRKHATYPAGFMTAVLCHDMGKPYCTSIDNKGIHHSYNHEAEGVPYAKRFLDRLTTENYLKKYVLNMVELHGEPHDRVTHNSNIKSTNHMFDKAVVPEDLILHCLADSYGKIPKDMTEREFLEERLQVYRETMAKPFVQGRDLIEAGIKPNKRFTEYLEFAHKLRLARVDKEDAMKQVISMAKKDKYKGASYDRD